MGLLVGRKGLEEKPAQIQHLTYDMAEKKAVRVFLSCAKCPHLSCSSGNGLKLLHDLRALVSFPTRDGPDSSPPPQRP